MYIFVEGCGKTRQTQQTQQSFAREEPVRPIVETALFAGFAGFLPYVTRKNSLIGPGEGGRHTRVHFRGGLC